MVCIAINPDVISEEIEGVFVVLSIDNNEGVEVSLGNQVALAVILDDDGKNNTFDNYVLIVYPI